jgi:NAD(P)-dependent dehydrogenase (short-subunit alcohol dehydrogenase family)
LAFAREGANVVVGSRTESEISNVSEEVRRLGRGKALAVKVDATNFEQVKAMVQKVVKEFGRVDILVNCQGLGLVRPTIETTMEDWNRVIGTNLTSVFQTCLAVLPQMLTQKGGHIINISSRTGAVSSGTGRVVAYATAKAGVVGLSKTLALELKPQNIKVNVICPGPMDTPMRWRDTPQFDPAKTIKPEYVAQLAVLLASMPDVIMQDAMIPASINF